MGARGHDLQARATILRGSSRDANVRATTKPQNVQFVAAMWADWAPPTQVTSTEDQDHHQQSAEQEVERGDQVRFHDLTARTRRGVGRTVTSPRAQRQRTSRRSPHKGAPVGSGRWTSPWSDRPTCPGRGGSGRRPHRRPPRRWFPQRSSVVTRVIDAEGWVAPEVTSTRR